MNLKLARNIRLGVKNLLLHKLRSMLTMLGVVFGVGSVVAMLSVGGQNFTVLQAGSACAYALSPTQLSYTSSGAPGTSGARASSSSAR